MLGFIGGSGLYQIEGISNVEFVTISSPFGNPSDDILLGELDGYKIAFLPRHGSKHTLNPSEINYRANIDVMKQLVSGTHPVGKPIYDECVNSMTAWELTKMEMK